MTLPEPPDVLVLSEEYTPFYALFHGFFIIWGLADLCWGFRIFKLTLSFLGSFVGMALGLLVIGQVPQPELWMWIAALFTGGVVGGALAYFVFQCGIFVLGFYAGVVVGAPLLDSLAAPDVLPYLTLITGILIGLLAVNVSKIMLITGTAVTGAFRVVYGVTFFLGGWNMVGLFMYPECAVDLLSASKMLFALTLGTAGAGIVYQFSQNKNSRKKASKEEDED